MHKLESTTMNAFDCMDERALLALLKKNLQSGMFEIINRGNEAEKVVTAKLPGGGLGFVKAVQQFGNKSLIEAFELVETTCESLGFDPMVHIDNHHGKEDIKGLSDEKLVEFAVNYYDGCGFAKLAWSDEASVMVKLAMERGWLIGVLGGTHGAREAVRITQEDKAVNRVKSDYDAFSFNIPETQKVLEQLGIALKDTVFANVAFDWLDNTFATVAKNLGKEINEIKTV